MEAVPVGTADNQDNQTISIQPPDRGKHLAVFGKTGTGKTTLMRNMALSDLQAGLGLTVLDPHGGLIDDLLDHIPRHRSNDVIYFNPAEPSWVPAINVLDKTARHQRPLVISALISSMRNIWPDNWGPRTEFILSNAAAALLEQPQPVSLIALPKLLTDPAYRADILKHVKDPATRWFFKIFEHDWQRRLREEAVAPLLNKLNKFVANPLLRAVIGQTRSSFDFRWAMDNGKILLCDLSKGALGEDVTSLLGSLIVTKLSLAALSRQDTPEEDRRPHILYADEIQNFIHGVDFPTILSEARKYALALVIGTQTLNQLPEKTIAAVFGNCATLVSFRVSGQDAKTLVREFAASGEGPKPVEQQFDVIVPASELQNLRDYKAYFRTLIAGQPVEPSLISTFPPFGRTGNENRRDRIINTSHQRFSRNRSAVEAKLDKFLTA